MNSILESAQKLRDTLMKQSCIKEFFLLKDMLDKSDINISKITNNDVINEPLVNNFLIIREETFSILKEISYYLSD